MAKPRGTAVVAPVPTEAAAAITWSVQGSKGLPGILAGVTHGGGRFLAAAEQTIYESNDGVAWEAIAEQRLDGSQIVSFRRTGEWFVATTSEVRGESADVSNWVSKEGSDWHQLSGLAADPNLGSISHLGDQWVAAGGPGKLYVAGDTGGWRAVQGPKPFDHVQVASAPDSVAMGVTRGVGAPTYFRARVLLSHDAQTWFESALAPGTALVEAIAWAHGRYVVLGMIREKRSAAVPDPNYDAAAWWSDDGQTWTAGEVEQDPNANTLLAAKIVPLAEGFVAIGSDGNDPDSLLWSSTDGSSWRKLESGDGISYPDVVDMLCAEDRLMVYITTQDGSTDVAISDQSVACPAR